MSYRTKIKHLSESNSKMADIGELLVSSTSGHISVKGPRGIVSRTKDIESRLSSITCVVDTFNKMLDTMNGKEVNDLCVGNILEDINARYKVLDTTFIKFKEDIDEKYATLMRMEDILRNIGTFIKRQDKLTNELRNENDEQSTTIRDLEELFTKKICGKMNNIQYYYYKHQIDYLYLERTYEYNKERLRVTSEKRDECLKKWVGTEPYYMGLEYNLFGVNHEITEGQNSIYTAYNHTTKAKEPALVDIVKDVYEGEGLRNRLLNVYERNKEFTDIPVNVYQPNREFPADVSESNRMVWEKCNRAAEGSKFVRTRPTGNSTHVPEMNVLGVAKAGEYVRLVQQNKTVNYTMSYDDFVDKCIGLIYDKYDITYYTPYTPLNHK